MFLLWILVLIGIPIVLRLRTRVATLERELQSLWGVSTRSAILSRDAPAFQC